MKHYILIQLSVPTRKHQQYGDWIELSEKLQKLVASTKGIVVLGESSWLIPRNDGMSFLAECIQGGNMYGFQHRIWFLDEAA